MSNLQYWMKGIEILFLSFGTFFDMKTRKLPMALFWIFGLLGVLGNVFFINQGVKRIVAGCVMGGFFLLIGRITNEALGYGDGLGILILSIYEGWKDSVEIIFYAFVVSALYGIFKIVVCGGNQRDSMPFFPFLLFAAAVQGVL